MIIELLNQSRGVWIAAGFLIGAFAFLQVTQDKKRSRLPLPPGPKGLPFVGNVRDIPQDKPWKVYGEWAKQYGDIIHFSALGQSLIVLNSIDMINDLLSARAANYSDRPSSPVIEMTGSQSSVTLKQYGEEWREYRRTFHHFFNPSQTPQFHPVMVDEVPRLLNGLLSNPCSFREVLKESFAMVIMRVSYGNDDLDYNKQLIREADSFIQGFMDYSQPGRLLVEVVHALRYVPAWFPGAGWKRALRDVNSIYEKVRREPFELAMQRSESGLPQKDQGMNVATQLIADLPPPSSPNYEWKKVVAIDVVSNAYTAGIDTTFSSAMGLIHALASSPEVQRKAHEEIDRIVGVLRLPTFADLDQLPYVQALIKEVGRWHSVVPMSVPHIARDEDEYNGYRIPAGAIILPNTWAIMHDPKVFENPMTFDPERYLKDGKLNPDVLDPEAAAFGYGRRICPGRHFSSEVLTLAVASILACFDIKPPKDENGRDIPMGEMDVTSVLISEPVPFDVSIVPRSEEHAHMIKTLADMK